jgi:hypothetical protein
MSKKKKCGTAKGSEKRSLPKGGAPQRRTAGEWKTVFLTHLRNHGVVRAAADCAGISRKTVYLERKKASDFSESWDEAIDEFCDTLEGLAFERAKKGSDALIIFLLKTRRPKIYGNKVERTGEDSGPIKWLAEKSIEELNALEAKLDALAKAAGCEMGTGRFTPEQSKNNHGQK